MLGRIYVRTYVLTFIPIVIYTPFFESSGIINAYNSLILISELWEANTDLQFITNAYACVMCVVAYISKGRSGTSNLLRQACDDAKGSTIQERVRGVGNTDSTYISRGKFNILRKKNQKVICHVRHSRQKDRKNYF